MDKLEIRLKALRSNLLIGLCLIDDIAIKNNIEIFRKIDGYDNYQVSTFGKVINMKTGKMKKLQMHEHGYYMVNLNKKNKGKCAKIHTLVANTFIANPYKKRCIDHIDNNRLNNNVNNLRFVTHNENNYNQSLNSRNTSGVKGVSFHKLSKQWRAYIKHEGKWFHLGLFANMEDAKKARQKKAKELFGEYMNKCEL